MYPLHWFYFILNHKCISFSNHNFKTDTEAFGNALKIFQNEMFKDLRQQIAQREVGATWSCCPLSLNNVTQLMSFVSAYYMCTIPYSLFALKNLNSWWFCFLHSWAQLKRTCRLLMNSNIAHNQRRGGSRLFHLIKRQSNSQQLCKHASHHIGIPKVIEFPVLEFVLAFP